MGRLPLGSPARRRGSSVRRSVDFRTPAKDSSKRPSPTAAASSSGSSSASSSQKTAATLEESDDCFSSRGFGAYDFGDLQQESPRHRNDEHDFLDAAAAAAGDGQLVVVGSGGDDDTLNGDAATTLTELINQVNVEERFSAWAAAGRSSGGSGGGGGQKACSSNSATRTRTTRTTTRRTTDQDGFPLQPRSKTRSPPRHSILPTISQLAAAQHPPPPPNRNRQSATTRSRGMPRALQPHAFPRGIPEEEERHQSLPPLMATPINPISPSSSPTPLLSPQPLSAESESESSSGSPPILSGSRPCSSKSQSSATANGGSRSLGSKILPKLHIPSLPHSKRGNPTVDTAPDPDFRSGGRFARRQFAETCHRDFNIGYVHLQTGRYRKALQHLEKSLQAYIMVRGADHLEVAKVHEVLGMAYDGMGDSDTAITHWEAVLRIIALHYARDSDSDGEGEEDDYGVSTSDDDDDDNDDDKGPQSVDRECRRRPRGGSGGSPSSLSSVDINAMRSRVKDHLMRLGVNPNARPQSHLAEC